MKRIVFLIALFLIVGCGSDGKDGNAYISINWVFTPNYYSDDNASTPETVYGGTYYQTGPGTYFFSYSAWDSSTWSGTYKITVKPGEDGDLFSDGANGADSYFELWCYSTGPEVYSHKTMNASEKVEPTTPTYIGQIVTSEKQLGRYNVTVKAERVQ